MKKLPKTWINYSPRVPITEELNAIKRFETMMRVEPEKTCYGLDHVKKAQEFGAIETLLITVDYVSSLNLAKGSVLSFYHEIDKLQDRISKKGGKVMRLHGEESIEKLDQFTGIAAILRFPIRDDQYEDCFEGIKSDDEEFSGPLDFL